MDLLLINLLNGVSFGMILFLFAMGLSITLGVMGILNLTHGALFMLGGFVGLTVVKAGGNFWLAVLAGGAIAGLLGLIIEGLLLRRLYRQLDDQVLLTLGLVYILGNIALWIYGGRIYSVPPPAFLAYPVDIGDFKFPLYRLTLIGIGVVAFFVLWWLIEKTRFGAIIRAGMDDRQMTTGLGLNYGLTSSIVFTIGAFAGGLAGFLATPVIGVVFTMSLDILLYALIVVVVGGTGSIQGTLLGALIIGVMDAFGKAYLQDFAMFTMYLVLIIMLLIKPTGILGRKQA